jgi:hypothetical protein
MRRFAIVLALSVFALACEGQVQSTTVVVSSSMSAPASSTSLPVTTSAFPGWPGVELLVTNEDGAFYVDSTRGVTRLVRGRVAFAVDDTRGGLLFQVERGRPEFLSSGEAADTRVWWVPQGSGEVKVLLAPTPGAGHDLTLYDASQDGAGHLQVVYVRSETPADYWAWFDCVYRDICRDEPVRDWGIGEELTDSLRVFDVETGVVTELWEQGAYEQGFGRVSTGAGLVVATEYDQVGARCFFLDPAAASVPGYDATSWNAVAVEVQGSPLDRDCDGCDCPEGCVLSPDGSMLAYGTCTVLSVVDTASGERVIDLEIPGTTAIDMDDRWMLVNRPDSPATIIDLENPDQTFEVPVAGMARFTTAPVGLDAPVTPPARAAIQLRADGLGVVDVGDPVEAVMAVLVTTLGAPSSDRTVTPDPQDGVAAGAECLNQSGGSGCISYFRTVEWDGLQVRFSDVGEGGKQTEPHLVGWAAWGGGFAFSTTDGVGVGVSVAELESAYGDAVVWMWERPCGADFRLGESGVYGWVDDPTPWPPPDGYEPNPDSRVTGLAAGAMGDC